MIFSHTKLIDIVEALFTTSISLQEALDWVLAADAELSGDADQLAAMIQESDYYDLAAEEVEHGLTGLMNYQEALVAVHDYIVEEYDEGLEVAVGKAEEALQNLEVARELNQEVRARLSFETLC